VSAALVAVVGFAAATLAATHAILHKRRPQSAFGWIAVCFTLPLAGPLLYYLFGINRVKTRAKKLLADNTPLCPTDFVGTPPPQLAPLAKLGAAVTDWPLTAGNRVEPLYSPEDIFAAMITSIEAAERYVYLTTYIADAGPLGQRFARALASAAERGVDVRVLVDGFGELYSWPSLRALLRGSKVRVARFLPPRLWPPTLRINLRNHRKSLIVDGGSAFTGGINLRDRYVDPNASRRIVDLHFRVTGPVIAQIETIFRRDWQFAMGEPAPPVESSPPLTPVGGALCRAIPDGPEGDLDRLATLLVGAISAARHRVAIMTPYFLPSRELVATLQASALSGVDVAIVLPEKNNLPYIHRATRHMLWDLVERGVQVYYRPPPFAHSKLFLVDDHYANIGSANFDARSLRLNFELNLEVYDRETVAELARHFESVRAASEPVTQQLIESRSLATKLVDGAAWLFSPYL